MTNAQNGPIGGDFGVDESAEQWLSRVQRQDPQLAAIIGDLSSGDVSRAGKHDNLYVVDGVLYRTTDAGDRRVAPVHARRQLIIEHHASPGGGHFYHVKTADRVGAEWWWPTLKQDVKTYCRGCVTCAARQGQGMKFKPPLCSIPVPSEPMEQVGMDILTIEHTRAGYKHMLVLVDYLTKFTYAYPMKNQEAKTCWSISSSP